MITMTHGQTNVNTSACSWFMYCVVLCYSLLYVPFQKHAGMKEAFGALLCCTSPLEMEGIASAG
jgi:hypothetical protein